MKGRMIPWLVGSMTIAMMVVVAVFVVLSTCVSLALLGSARQLSFQRCAFPFNLIIQLLYKRNVQVVNFASCL